jgi:hypothetical protein
VTVSERERAIRLRRWSASVPDGRLEDDRTGEHELVCVDWGDAPEWSYREVPRQLQRVRGPYPLKTGIEAFVEHRESHRPVSEESPCDLPDGGHGSPA